MTDKRKAAAERKRLERQRKKDAGLIRRDVWAHPDDWPVLRKLEEDLQNKRIKS